MHVQHDRRVVLEGCAIIYYKDALTCSAEGNETKLLWLSEFPLMFRINWTIVSALTFVMFSGTVSPHPNTVVFALSSPAPLSVSDCFKSSYKCSINRHGFPLTQSFADFKQDIEDQQQ